MQVGACGGELLVPERARQRRLRRAHERGWKVEAPRQRVAKQLRAPGAACIAVTCTSPVHDERKRIHRARSYPVHAHNATVFCVADMYALFARETAPRRGAMTGGNGLMRVVLMNR